MLLPAATKVTARTAPTKNTDVKVARAEAKESGKIANQEVRNTIVSETKVAQKATKKTNKQFAKAGQNTASSGAAEYVKRKTDQQ